MTRPIQIDRKELIIAIDGPSGVGKSTVSKRIAERLGLTYVDTGAMYRAVALAVAGAKVDIENSAALEEFCNSMLVEYTSGSISVNATDYTDSIRTEEASKLASVTSSKEPVRRALVMYQRSLAVQGGVVMEGRDIGTVVLPRIHHKFFLTASHEVRAERRRAEHDSKGGTEPVGSSVGAKDISENMKERDRLDSTRAESPLARAVDALEIDTAELDIDGVVGVILADIEQKVEKSRIK
ncbi:MAG: (d)CMP kinase [Proteobacteria bacterium]|nr:(d)CMP kinase [Pseudomonadota bacterium]